MTFLFPRELADEDHPVAPFDQALFDAVIANDPAALRARLAAGVPPDHPSGDLNRMTPLIYAILGGFHDCMRLLLDAGADVHLIDGQKGRTPLRAAIQMQDETAVKMLLDYGADPGFASGGARPDGTQYGGVVTDEQIAQEGDPGIAALVIAARVKFKVNELARANSADIDAVRALLEAGAPVDIKNHNGQTALMYACLHRNADMVKLLLEHGADTEITWRQGGSTALRLAVGAHMKKPDLPIVKMLLAHGADLHKTDARGRSMIHAAVTGANEDIIKIVVENGLSLTARDAEGRTPIDAAAEWGSGDEAAPVVEKVAAWRAEGLEEIGRNAVRLDNPVKPLKKLSLAMKR